MTKNLFEISFDHKGFDGNDAKNLLETLGKTNAEAKELKDNIENISISKPLADASKLKESIVQLAKASDIKIDLKELDKSFDDISKKVPEIKKFLSEIKSNFDKIDDPNALKALQQSIAVVEAGIKDFEVSTKNAAKSQDGFIKATQSSDKSVKELSKDLFKLDATFEDIYGDLRPMTGRIGELEDRMYELANAGRANTSEYQALEKELIKLKKTIFTVDQSVDAAFENNRNIVATAEGLNLLVGGFQVYEGVMASLGVESEDLQKTMTRLLAVQNIANGVQEINNTLIRNSATFTKALSGVQNILSRSNIFVAETTGLATASQKTFNKALLSSGIGAIVIGLGLLIANYDKVSDALSGVTSSQKLLNEAYEDSKAEIQGVIESTIKQEIAFNQAREGVISKEQALRDYNETFGDTLGVAKDFNEAEQLFIDKKDAFVQSAIARATATSLIGKAAELNIELLEEQDRTATLIEKGLTSIGLGGAVGLSRTGRVEELKNELEDVKKLITTQLKEASDIEAEANINGINRVANNNSSTRSKAQKERIEKEKEYQVELSEIQDKEYANAIRKAEEYYKNYTNVISTRERELKDFKIENIKDSLDQELANLEFAHEEYLNQLDKQNKENAQRLRDSASSGFISIDEAESKIKEFERLSNDLKSQEGIAYEDRRRQIAQEYLQRAFQDVKANIAQINSERERDLANEIFVLSESYTKGTIAKDDYERQKKEIEDRYREESIQDKTDAFNDQIQALQAQLEKETDVRKKIGIETQINDLKQARDEALTKLNEANTNNANLGDSIFGKIFGIDPSEEGFEEKKQKILDGLTSIVSSATDILKEYTRAEIEAYDQAIQLQEKRVSEATKLAEQGNTEYLKIEEERLEKLQQKREEAARRQLEIDAAVQASQILVAIAGAVAQIAQGGAVGVITGIATIAGAIASGFALLNQLNAARPKFFEGTMYSISDSLGKPHRAGRDGYDISVDGSERVVKGSINRKLGRVKSEDLPSLVEKGKLYNNLVSSMPSLSIVSPNVGQVESKTDLSQLINEFAEFKESQKETTKAIRKINIKMGISPEGVYGLVKGIEKERFKLTDS